MLETVLIPAIVSLIVAAITIPFQRRTSNAASKTAESNAAEANTRANELLEKVYNGAMGLLEDKIKETEEKWARDRCDRKGCRNRIPPEKETA